MNKKSLALVLTALLLISLACSAPGMSAPSATPPLEGAAATAAIQTYQVLQSQTAQAGGAGQPVPTQTLPPAEPSSTTAPSDTPAAPSNTPEPSLTPTQTVTLTQATPCNWAQFITDVTIPDDSPVLINANFTKTWRLKNIGTCTWTSGYKLIFDHGDAMSAPAEVQLTPGTVAPGGTVDVSVALKAPGSEGTYRGDFRLKSADNQIFGIGATADRTFYVQIVAQAPSLPPPVTIADLVITDISWSPSPIHDDTPIHFKIKFRNQGSVNAGPFTIRFWARSTFAQVSCAWAVPGLAASDGEEVDCNFTFASFYPAGETKAVIDVNDEVDEVNEGNNTYTEEITVLP